MVRLPLQKAQALDPAGDAFNEQIDANRRQNALAQRKQCYKIITNALRSLKGETAHRPTVVRSVPDPASRSGYVRQIVQLGVQSPDKAFHEHLYCTLIDLGLENELLEYGGPDLVPFLQNAGHQPAQEVSPALAILSHSLKFLLHAPFLFMDLFSFCRFG